MNIPESVILNPSTRQEHERKEDNFVPPRGLAAIGVHEIRANQIAC